MKLFSAFILGLFFILTASSSFAVDQIVYVTGYGQSSQYCQANDNYFCQKDLERESERRGEQDADTECRYRGGVLQNSYNGCSTTCSPSFLPPNNPPTWMSCRSTCSLPCAIPQEDNQ